MTRKRTRQANALTDLAVMAAALVAAAFVVDLGWGWAQRSQLQSIADATSTAAASRLDGTMEGLIAAQTSGNSAAMNNMYYGEPRVISVTDGTAPVGDQMVFGVWDLELETFYASDVVEEINAAKVLLREPGSDAWFAPALWAGVNGMQSSVQSTAVHALQGAGTVDCYLPIALPQCHFDEDERESFADRTLVLSPAGEDNMGWARVGQSPNTDWLRNHVEEPCEGAPAGIGDEVYLHNGVATPVIRSLEHQLEHHGADWAPEMGAIPPQHDNSTHGTYGKTWEAPLLVFAGGPEYCESGGGSWNGSSPVVGIAWGVVYDIASGSSPEDRNVYMRVDFVREWDVGSSGGGPNYGVTHLGITQLVE